MRVSTKTIEIEEEGDEEELDRTIHRWIALSELVAPLRPARVPPRRDAEDGPVEDPERDHLKAPG